MKKILITGANSYVGTCFEKYIKENHEDEMHVETLDMLSSKWKNSDFSQYDTIFHVAGIAHSDGGKISAEKEKLYRSVNTQLAISVAEKAKHDGVKQFIFMSSAIIYGKSGKIGKSKNIECDTKPDPENCYGDSKLKAEMGLNDMNDQKFKVCILRCPMIYGKESKGNFKQLEKFASKLSFFPKVKNQRSMLYIGNLVHFVYLMIKNAEHGTFWPQNKEYSNTSDLVQLIAKKKGRKIRLIKGCTWLLKFLGLFTNKVAKAFGNLTYDYSISTYKENYWIYSLEESIEQIEK